MVFEQWAMRHGLESARKQFGLSDHLVFIVYPNKRVWGQCGNWKGSEPLQNPMRNPTVEAAKQHIRDALCNCFETEETIIDDREIDKKTNVDA